MGDSTSVPQADAFGADLKVDGESGTVMLEWEERDAIWEVAYSLGFDHGRQAVSEDLARQWLHDDAMRWQRSAVKLARRNHGADWAAAIGEQSEDVG